MLAAELQTGERTAFVQCLSEDLAKGNIELPSFPDVVVRVRKALNDEHTTTDDLVRIIGAEPVLAARVLSIANSAAMKRGSDPVTSLNIAVNRLGRSIIKSTAMAFALARLRSGRKLESVKTQLKSLWQRSVHVASLCYVIAKNFTKLDPDEALFIGLMHGIGELYILVSADERPDLFADAAELKRISEEWGSSIGSIILDGWGFSPHVSHAASQFRETGRDHEGPIDYADVTILAFLLFGFTATGEDEIQVAHLPAWRQLELESAELFKVLRKSDELILSLCRSLGN